MHVRCFAHIINLMVIERLRELHGSIVTIRNVLRYVRSSPTRLQKFKTCVEQKKNRVQRSLGVICANKVEFQKQDIGCCN